MNTVKLFEVIDTSCQLLSKELQVSYTQALAETLQNLAFEQKAQQIDGLPSQETVDKLTSLYQSVSLASRYRKEIHQAIQLAFLQAIKKDNLQANQHMTPDSIGLLLSVLLKAVVTPRVVADISAGSGNLLSLLLNQYQEDNTIVTSYASEVDDILASILAMSLSLQGHTTQVLHQDSIQPLFIQQPDLIVSDLPVGFYPNDVRAAEFSVSVKNEHTYAHHLLIEHSMQILEPGGWGVFVVPSNIFETPQSPQLLSLFKDDQYYVQACLALPETLFKNVTSRKSVLMLQKPGGYAKKAKHVLIAQIPSLKDAKSLGKFMSDYQLWADTVK